MTTTFATETTTPFVSRAVEAVVEAVRALHARRTQRLALAALIEMDPGRLDDLGITVQDVQDAMQAPQAGRHLEARRTVRANTWTAKVVAA
ncbi:hypothetical protein VE25_11580 [Devosia geojensis]|uniref:DUF1127 domain-containing protein n=1 Tax=Devosia geojensis TaxID=443610 RepID=A0A0F5FRX9_9HYPH|nr:hypothetical protein [Devosia geojensis]KKB11624.1 hypothetical protein VE25_11580 [Devosia geojensis]